ncbi:MAG: response regulator [Spirochaetales bacterium]|nr:response regulator [Spirochaetales bacterium]
MNIYIVDDEKNIRNSIKDYLPWDRTRITGIYTAKNGIDALEKMETVKPDILLSDVRMPKMNGILLAERVQVLYPDCITIFLSGYTDTDYLKSAIRIGAMQYIEKPLEVGEILKVVLNAQDMLLQRKRQSLEFLKWKQHSIANRNSISSEWLRQFSLFKGDLSRINNVELLDTPVLHGSVPVYPLYIVPVWAPETDSVTKGEVRNSIIRHFNEMEILDDSLYGFLDSGDLLVLGNENYSGEKIENISQILPSLLRDSDFSITSGRGLGDMQDLYKALKILKRACQLYYYDGKKLHHNKDGEYRKEFRREELKEQFAEAAAPLDEQGMSVFLDTMKALIQEAADPDIDSVSSFYRDLFRNFTASLKKEQPDKFNPDILFEGSIHESGSFSAFHNDFAFAVLSHIRSIRDMENQGSRISRILNYINRNYSDVNLSVESLSNHFELSSTYLCTIFKSSTGKTLHQYILEVRIEEAGILLKTTNDRIYEIARKVGFQDTNYFSTVFKKEVGKTPLQYRK